MARVIAGMTMSLDGFVADRDGGIGALYEDLEALRDTAYMRAMVEETGAVLMGRRAFEMGEPDWYLGNYEFQVPIFVVTHHPPAVPPKQDERLTFPSSRTVSRPRSRRRRRQPASGRSPSSAA